MALSEVGRLLRLANLIFGAWLIPAPLLLTGYPGLGAVTSVTAGVLLILLTLPVGRSGAIMARGIAGILSEQYGAIDKAEPVPGRIPKP
jgi:hypothetical protein